MDYKEKYEKAVQAAMLAKQNTESAVTIQTLDDIFPELNESKDEKIRKAIINVFASHKDYEIYYGVSAKDILAWLEKQGEQKPTDNIEPKFHEGEWIVNPPVLSSSSNIGKNIPAEWSEEDERERKRVVGLLEGWLSTFKETCYAEDCKCGINWLKSLKEKVQQQSKQE